MRILFIILLVLVAIIPTYSQTSNVRFGIMSGFADNNVTYGVTAGFDRKLGKKHAVSFDVDAFHLCKHAGDGGCGYEYQARLTVGRRISEHFILQTGVARSQYKVERYGKSSTQYLIGAKYTIQESLTTELNYRHDLTSNNHARFIEIRAIKYFDRHLFIRGGWALSMLKDAEQNKVTGSLTGAAGIWF